MDYNKLKTFVTVAECGSMTQAASDLLRSQSAITQQIQILEEELSLRLFERKGGRIFLSADGQHIFRLAKEKLGEIDDGIEGLKKSLVNIEGHIRLGALQDGGTEFNCGEAVAQFCLKYSKVRFSIHGGTQSGLEQDLVNNNIDLAFSVVFERPEMFVRTKVLRADHSLYSSQKYLETHGLIDNYKKVIQADIVDITTDMLGFRTFFAKNAKGLLPTLRHRRPAIVAPNFVVAKDIVLSGFGIAMLPDHLAMPHIKNRRLVRLLPNAKPLYGVLDVAYRTNRTLRLCERLFIRSVAEKET